MASQPPSSLPVAGGTGGQAEPAAEGEGWCLPLLQLPDAVWDGIIALLRSRHRAALRGVCRRLRDLVNSSVLRIKVGWSAWWPVVGPTVRGPRSQHAVAGANHVEEGSRQESRDEEQQELEHVDDG